MRGFRIIMYFIPSRYLDAAARCEIWCRRPDCGLEYASTRQQVDGIQDMVLQLEEICSQACIELTEEYNLIKSAKIE